MVSVHFPSSTVARRILSLYLDVPYFVLEDGTQPDGINRLMIQRVSGLVNHKWLRKKAENVKTKRMKRQAIRKLQRIWHRFLKFLRCAEAHPSLGVIEMENIQSWHLTELYEQAHLQGLWSKEFEMTGIKTVLSGPSSVRPAIRELTLGLKWLAHHGYIPRWEDKPASHSLRVAHDLELYRKTVQMRVGHHDKRKLRDRQNPGDHRPHTPGEISKIIDLLPTPGAKLAFMFPLRHGTRLEETLENTFLPDTMLQRPEHLLKVSSPKFPPSPYRTRFDPDNDDMIGVLPSADEVFLPDEMADNACLYRIVGKGPKIRIIVLHVQYLRALWYYVTGCREKQLECRGLHLEVGPPNAFLNSRGMPLTTSGLSKSVTRANNELGFTLRVTIHSLRHTYACAFLEAVILDEAQKDGVVAEELTIKQIEHYSHPALIVLQDFLGHEEMKTTRRYLRKLIASRLGLQYQKIYNEHLNKLANSPEEPTPNDETPDFRRAA